MNKYIDEMITRQIDFIYDDEQIFIYIYRRDNEQMNKYVDKMITRQIDFKYNGEQID